MANWWIFYIDGDGWKKQHVRRGDVFDWWTCHKNTRQGDFGLIYAKAPVSGLVGVLRALEHARLGNNEWSAHEDVCSVKCAAVFKRTLFLKAMRDDEELQRQWKLVDRSFQSHFGRPPQIAHETLTLLTARIPELGTIVRGVGYSTARNRLSRAGQGCEHK